MKKLPDILAAVSQETGVGIVLFSEFGTPIFGAKAGEKLPSAERFVDGYYVDTEKEATYFILDGVPSGYVAKLEGAGDAVLSLARVLKFYLTDRVTEKSKTIEPTESLRAFLIGAGTKPSLTEIKALFPFGLNHFLLVIFHDGGRQKQTALCEFLKTASDKGDFSLSIDGGTLVYFKAKNEAGDYRSAYDFGRVLYENIKEEMRIELKIAAGTEVQDFDNLPFAYALTATAHRFGLKLNPNRDVYRYGDFVCVKALAEIDRETLSKYVAALSGHHKPDVFSDPELMATADEFLSNSLNISETSRDMFIHRNTLIYRLDKIEAETGLNLRNFSDAQVFQLLRALLLLLQNSER